MLTDPTDRAITMAIVGLGHTLGLKVVAEGVEREAEAAVLREGLCDELQGFLFARPMPAEALATWIAARKALRHESSHEGFVLTSPGE
jgi:EAL domain-containing protein (putative c-di-GMP-specific phosphodiesterase class I)